MVTLRRFLEGLAIVVGADVLLYLAGSLPILDFPNAADPTVIVLIASIAGVLRVAVKEIRDRFNPQV